ncbi:hypothetical protein CVT25_007884 [Psilocybe cyanescens]|uniref:Uncharacterized protein n=1 Tax=Psilocybe cyanescens TaxID=93625 RepID=A0A409XJH1_PSICY|nr:hypothetical protein CVT25_007884 [Psilocybe cyanescens]
MCLRQSLDEGYGRDHNQDYSNDEGQGCDRQDEYQYEHEHEQQEESDDVDDHDHDGDEEDQRDRDVMHRLSRPQQRQHALAHTQGHEHHQRRQCDHHDRHPRALAAALSSSALLSPSELQLDLDLNSDDSAIHSDDFGSMDDGKDDNPSRDGHDVDLAGNSDDVDSERESFEAEYEQRLER